MSVDLLKLCDPEAHYDKFIAEDIYPDGRQIGTFGAIYFKSGAYGGVGSSLVRQGDVTISCSIKASISLVNDGPLISAEFDNKGDLKEKVVNETLDTLNSFLSLDSVLPRSSLICRGTEESVPLTWKLAIHIRVLNSSGSLVDAVVAAVSYALANVELPMLKLAHAKDDEASVEKSEISVLPEKYRLDLLDIPVCSTFALYDTTSLEKQQKSVVLCDPPADMLPFCRTKFLVVAGKTKILNFKLRGAVDDPLLLNSIFDMAMGRQAAVAKSLKR